MTTNPTPAALLSCPFCSHDPMLSENRDQPNKVACKNVKCSNWRLWFDEGEWQRRDFHPQEGRPVPSERGVRPRVMYFDLDGFHVEDSDCERMGCQPVKSLSDVAALAPQ